jgi:bifunctional non-homologous end joining protein LigD
MKATLVNSMPTGSWIYEIKFDGYRALALRGGNQTEYSPETKKTLAKNFTSSRTQSPRSMFRMLRSTAK